MKLRIAGWSIKSIRAIDHMELDLLTADGSVYPVTLVMMPNGVGKTTTINLLRAAFDGTAVRWPRDRVRSFRPIERTATQGEFRVKLLIGNDYYVLDLVLDFEEGTATYYTSRVGEVGGKDEGYFLPTWIKRTFTEEFVKRFVFDGELAKQISDSSSDEAQRTIRYLYSLDRLTDLSHTLDEILENSKRAAASTSAQTTRALSQIQSRRHSMEAMLRTLECKRKELEEEDERLRREAEELERALNDMLATSESLSEEAAEVQSRRQANASEAASLTKEILGRIRHPLVLNHSFADRLRSLYNSMHRLKLPRTTSRQFFVELSEQDVCVCNRPIGPDERAAIIRRAETYLGDDEIGAMNAIKEAIRHPEGDTGLETSVERLALLIEESQKLKTDWARLQTQLEESGHFEAGELRSALEDVCARRAQIADDLSYMCAEDQTRLNERPKQNSCYLNIPWCQRECRALAQKEEEATNTVRLSQQVEKMKQYIQLISNEAFDEITKIIKEKTNAKLAEIIKTERLLVETIDKSLKIAGKDATSEGQGLAVAYSFLGSMFEDSSLSLPFVVDTPAGPLDLDVRRRVSEVLPALFRQLVIFITSGEREAFVDKFCEMGDKVKYVTVSKNLGQPVTVIEGRDCFETFQGGPDETTDRSEG